MFSYYSHLVRKCHRSLTSPVVTSKMYLISQCNVIAMCHSDKCDALDICIKPGTVYAFVLDSCCWQNAVLRTECDVSCSYINLFISAPFSSTHTTSAYERCHTHSDSQPVVVYSLNVVLAVHRSHNRTGK